MTTERLEALRSILLFAELGDEALDEILGIATEFEAPANQVLIQPGLEGAGLFVLEEGTVMVERGDTHIELGPGEFFGEIALLVSGSPHTARVRTTTSIRCLAIARNDFANLLEKQPRIAITMLGVLAKRLADTMRH